ncbi:MAG TPA: DNA internalization-related competence protein ComEC/Rec2 [Candidatus Coprousia avicola]|nr:DNA internalization-related competence protein ComEC/Rec2 [Candidatus Coprousia avicola]
MPVATPAGDLPPRPLMPYSMAGALAELAVAGCLMELGWRGFAGGAGTATAAAAAVALGCVALAGFAALGRFGPHARALLRWAVMGALAGSFASAGALISRGAGYEALMGAAVRTGTMVTAGDPTTTSFGSSIDAGWYGPEGGFPVSVTLETDEVLELGEHLRCVGRVERLADDEWGRRSFMEGKAAAIRAVHIEPERGLSRAPWDAVRERVLSALEPDRDPARALIAGIVCGRTTELAAADADASFSRTGTSHLVAVSGSHLALVSALVILALRVIGAGPAARAAVLAVVMGSYVLFTGCAASALRSLVMVTAALAAQVGGRRAHGISGLALAIMVLVAVQPGVVYDLGFQLSAVSVAAIHLLFGYAEALLQGCRMPRAVASPLALTLVAQLATLPLTVPIFGEVSLVAPIANLLLGPLMTALLVAGLIGAVVSVALPGLSLVWAPALLLSRLSLFVADALAAPPWAAVTVDPSTVGAPLLLAPYGLAAAAYIRWRLPKPRLLAAGSLATVTALGAPTAWMARFAPASITVLDVGQADAILVREGSSALLVDAGVDEQVRYALARQRVTHLDAVVITHWDSDHWGGLPDVLDAFPVDRVLVAKGAAADAPREVKEGPSPLEEIALGSVIRVGGFEARVVWPHGEVAGEENGDSLVLDVTYEGAGGALRMLLTGDTEADEANAYADSVGDIDVLKVGHHGSAASVDEGMLAALTPELAVASAGEGNAYGHPSREARQLLAQVGCPFICTIEAGDVTLFPDEEGARVATARPCPIDARSGYNGSATST